MHPLNQMRLQAGITIDAKLEMVTEAKKKKPDADKDGVPDWADQKPGKDDKKKVTEMKGSAYPGCENEESSKTKFTKGKKFPGLEKCPKGRDNKECDDVMESHFPKGTHLTDPQGKCWEVTGYTGEGDDEVYQLKCPKTGKTADKKYSSIKGWKKDLKEMMGYEQEEQKAPSNDFRQGERVMYDNGIWVVYIRDAQADMVGVIPPSMKRASKEEKDKAVQMVKPEKLRRMSQEEEEAVGARRGMTEGRKEMMSAAMSPNPKAKAGKGLQDMANRADEKRALKKGKKTAVKEEKAISRGDNKKAARDRLLTGKGAEEHVKTESMHNYHTGAYPISHADTVADPINSVGHGDDNWKTDPKGELPTQMDVRGDQSMDDYANEVKVPATIKSALKEAVDTLRKEAEKQGLGHTAQENRAFYENAAVAFDQLLDLLQEGSHQSMKKAQLHAMSLMGPMLHKLPESVWNFLTTGGQRRSLKDYMIKV